MTFFKRIHFLNAARIFVSAVLVIILGTYFVFDMYVGSVSRELVSSWIQSESVSIQEGNLLSSIAKGQRVLLSSQFIQGIALFDLSTSPPQRLIEEGSPIDAAAARITGSNTVEIVSAGFFHKHAIYHIPDKPNLVLVFDIESVFLERFFFATVALLTLFLITLFGSIRTVQRREYARRESYLKTALTDFITNDHPSDFIRSELPFMVRWWHDKKQELEAAYRKAVEDDSKILLGELAARVAHDIRAPLGTLSSIVSEENSLTPEADRLFKGAVQLIRDIASDLSQQSRAALSSSQGKLATRCAALTDHPTEPVLLFPILEDIVSQKRLQYKTSLTEIQLDLASSAYGAFALLDVVELKRTLSNLIDNAVQAILDQGSVTIHLEKKKNRIEIAVIDTGHGMSNELIRSFGEKPVTYGKLKGSGLGLFYAIQSVANWGGALKIESRINKGTSVIIDLPQSSPPAWISSEVKFAEGSTVVVLDDDAAIHEEWQERFVALGLNIQVEHFFDPQSAQTWLDRHRDERLFLLSDFDLKTDGMTGLDLIEKTTSIHRNVILVTSSYERADIQARCKGLDIKILPKPAISSTPILIA